MMITFVQLLLLQKTTAFVTIPTLAQPISPSSLSRFSTHARSNQQLQDRIVSRSIRALHAEKKHLTIVVGNEHAALGASMALCARGVLGENSEELRERRQPVPPAQLVAFFNHPAQQYLSSETIASLQNSLLFIGTSKDDYEQTLVHALMLPSRIENGDSYGSPILLTSLDSKEGSCTLESLFTARNRFSFLGLNLNTKLVESEDGRFILSREDAIDWGNKMQQLLERGQAPAAVTMDVATHLAMLQANSLPRSRGILGICDVWAVRDIIQNGMTVDNDYSMLLEYQYDYNDPFGGMDPLLRPSRGYIIPSPFLCNLNLLSQVNDAHAAAYSALRGCGMDPLSSICVATAVKATFAELGKFDTNGVFFPPTYTWDVIERIVGYSHKVMQNVLQEDGLPRKKYREFGYK